MHEVLWTQALLAEWERVIVREQRRTAAAIAGGAEAIVTWNQTDFPAGPLPTHRIRVHVPDEYLCDLLDAWPDEVLGTVVRLAGEKRRPPMTPTDLTNILAKANVPSSGHRLAQTHPVDRLPPTGLFTAGSGGAIVHWYARGRSAKGYRRAGTRLRRR